MEEQLRFLHAALRGAAEFALVALPTKGATHRTFHQFIGGEHGLVDAAGSMLYIKPFPDALPRTPIADTKAHYLDITQKAVDAIHAGEFQKVVLARTKIVEHISQDRLADAYARLVAAYPTALVFLLRTREHGTWIGATPELLIEKGGTDFHTIALAATSAMPRPQWSPKDYDEHEHVASYLERELRQAGVARVVLDGPHPSQYGNLTHLKTDISFTSDQGICDLVRRLHPTPALCGYQTEAALRFIQQHEATPRDLYTGSMVIERADGDGVAYAFLRCGKLAGTRLTLYAGCGIVAASNPHKEWEESEAKIASILSNL